MANEPSRRDLIKLTTAGVAALVPAAVSRGAALTPSSPPASEVSVRLTAGRDRFASMPSLRWHAESRSSANAIVIDSKSAYQEILGFGAAFTDAACYTFNRLSIEEQASLFRELFGASSMGLNVCRICLGSSDYSRTLYSYDEGAPDPELKRFTIDHDREYILPVLKSAREANPDLFLLGSPWSPPGWMKANGSMLGGSMRKPSFPAYAQYFVKFLQGYAAAGVPVQAITVQNELDTDQDGRMAACLWGQEYETAFISDHLGPELARNNLTTKIWIIDHNYNLWGRAICELDDAKVNRFVDGVAWHGYVGEPDAMTRVHQAHPDKHMYWTEGGPGFDDPKYATDWTQWGTTFSGILRNWARCIIGWNLALDEAGKPNIGPFNCGGMVTIHSKTNEISRSGQYWAFMHYSSAIRRGAKRVESAGEIEGVSHVAAVNPDGTHVAVLTNAGAPTKATLRISGMETSVDLPGDSMTTLTWK